jgi:hypothetical protein
MINTLSKPGVCAGVAEINRTSAETASVLKEALYRITGEKMPQRPAEIEQSVESLRGQLQESTQLTHEVLELARSIFEAL